MSRRRGEGARLGACPADGSRGPDPAPVRAWAVANGGQGECRGRIAASVLAQFEAAGTRATCSPSRDIVIAFTGTPGTGGRNPSRTTVPNLGGLAQRGQVDNRTPSQLDYQGPRLAVTRDQMSLT